MSDIFFFPRQRALDSNATPAPGWKLNFYKSGTSTRKDTFSDENLTTPNTNPVVADAEGEFSTIYLAGEYKVVLTDQNDVQQWTVDPFRSGGGGSDISADNIKELVDVQAQGLQGGETAFVRAFYSDTDTGGGHFYWDADRDKSTANGGTIIDPDTVGTLSATALGTFLTQQGSGVGTGCWVRLYGGDVFVDWFGAKAGGVFDNAEPVASADAYAATINGTVRFSPGTYLGADHDADSAVYKPSSGVSWVGAGMNQTTLKGEDNTDWVVLINNIDGLRVSDLGVTTGTTTETGTALVSGGNDGFNTPAKNIVLERVHLYEGGHYALAAWDSPDSWVVRHCRVENVHRVGLEFVGAESIRVHDNVIIGVGDDAVAFNGTSANCKAYNNIVSIPKADGTLIKGTGTTAAGFKIHHRHIQITNNLVIGAVAGLVSIKQDNQGRSQPGDILVEGNTLDGMSDASIATQGGIVLADIGSYDGPVLFSNNTVIAKSEGTDYRPFRVRNGGSSTATVKVIGNHLEGSFLDYGTGGLKTLDIRDNTAIVSSRFLSILTDTQNGDLVVSGNTVYGTTGNIFIFQQPTSAGLDSLSVSENSAFGFDSDLINLQSAAVTTLYVGTNTAPDISAGDRLKLAGSVTDFRGIYHGATFHDFASVADGATATSTSTVTGARTGMSVDVGVADGLTDGVFLVGRVSSDDTVSFTLVNHSGSAFDLGNRQFLITAWRPV